MEVGFTPVALLPAHVGFLQVSLAFPAGLFELFCTLRLTTFFKFSVTLFTVFYIHSNASAVGRRVISQLPSAATTWPSQYPPAFYISHCRQPARLASVSGDAVLLPDQKLPCLASQRSRSSHNSQSNLHCGHLRRLSAASPPWRRAVPGLDDAAPGTQHL